jgi:hypothetical protein
MLNLLFIYSNSVQNGQICLQDKINGIGYKIPTGLIHTLGPPASNRAKSSGLNINTGNCSRLLVIH